jgi:hypothetical protein
MWSARLFVNRVLPIILLTNLALVVLVITYRTVGRGPTSSPVHGSEAAVATAAFDDLRGGLTGPGNPSVEVREQEPNAGPTSSVSEQCEKQTPGCLPPTFESTALRVAGATAAGETGVQLPPTLCEDVPSSDEACAPGNITTQSMAGDAKAPAATGCPALDRNTGGIACDAGPLAPQGEAPDVRDPAPGNAPVSNARSSDRLSGLGSPPRNAGSTRVTPAQRANPTPGSLNPPAPGFTENLMPSPTATPALATATAVPASGTSEPPAPTPTSDSPTATAVPASGTSEPPAPTPTSDSPSATAVPASGTPDPLVPTATPNLATPTATAIALTGSISPPVTGTGGLVVGGNVGIPNPAQTPELGSLALFGTGAAGLAGYMLVRLRNKRPHL